MAAVAGDRADALGVLVGGAIVLVFFGVDVATLKLSAELDPAVTFLLVMTEYLTKIMVLAVVLVALSRPGRGGRQGGGHRCRHRARSSS